MLYYNQSMPSSFLLTHLRQRKRRLLAPLQIPPDALPGSLALTHRRCGKPSCHCADGQGHPLWLLTFMRQGQKQVQPIPADWVESVRQQVEAGREFRQAVAEILGINAELLALERQASRQRRRPTRSKRPSG
jgi:hypothetical protein